MASPAELAESFLLGIVLVIIGFIMLLSVSMQWDILDPVFVSAGMENVPATWNTFDDRDWLIDQIYFIIYGLFILAPAQFIFVAVRKQTYDQYVEIGR